MVSLAAERTVSLGIATPSRAGWLLIASAVTFVVALVFLFVVGVDYYDELTTAADAANTDIGGVPEVERARIAGDHAVFYVISVTLLLVPYVVLALANHDIASVTRSADEWSVNLGRAAWWGSLACLSAWAFYSVVSLGLLAGPGNLPPLVRDINAFALPLISTAAVIGAVAVGCAALAVRRARIAPRIALATVIILGLFLLATLVESIATGELAEVPQFLPLIPALLLGIGLVRVGSTSQA